MCRVFQNSHRSITITGNTATDGSTITNTIVINEIHSADGLVKTALPVARNPVDTYIGHTDDMDAVLGLLKDGAVLIHALGGIGKTEFCYKLAKEKIEGKAFILNCSGSAFNALASCVTGVPMKAENKVFCALEKINGNLTENDLIIFDNIHSNDDFKYANGLKCKVIFTSRKPFDEIGYVRQYPLELLSEEEGVELFMRYYENGEEAIAESEYQAAHEIVKRIGIHTLSIELLAKTCRRSRKTAQELLKALRANGIDIGLAETVRQNDSEEEQRFFEHIEKLFDTVGILKEAPRCKDLLKKLSVLDVTDIPAMSLARWCCEKDFTRINILTDIGLIQRDGEFLSVHNIISELLRIKLKPRFKDIKDTVNIILGELRAVAHDDKLRYSGCPAEAQAAAVLNTVNDGSRIIGNIAVNCGALAYCQGRYDEAIEYYKRALPIKERYLGTKRRYTANAYNDIGEVYYAKGNYDLALKYFKKALEIYEKVLGTEHSDTASIYINIALVHKVNGNYDSAIEYYEKALAIKKNTVGSEHPDTAKLYNNIGAAHHAKGDYDSALDCFKKALEIYEKVLCMEHPDTATTYCNFAKLFKDKGEYDSALEYYEKALEVFGKVLPKEHPDIAKLYNNIGAAHHAKGDNDTALNYYKKALKIYEKVLGTEHPDIAMTYNNIGVMYRAKGKYDCALERYKKALAIQEKVFGTEHPATATTYNNIALVYQDKGKDSYNSALRFYQKALAIRENVLGEKHPDTAVTYGNIGSLYYRMRKPNNAKNYLLKALKVFKAYGNSEKIEFALSYLKQIYREKYGKHTPEEFNNWISSDE